MSWLRFNKVFRTIELFPGSDVGARICSIYKWTAHNDTASYSDGPWPVGTYKWTHYKEHAEAGFGPACLVTSYGCRGIHVFGVQGREGMGVHAGRMNFNNPANPIGGRTMGCVRVTEEAMTTINFMHNSDPITNIVIE